MSSRDRSRSSSRNRGGGPSDHGNGRGEKRGRDRNDEAGPSSRPDRAPRGNQSGKGKRREEFVDQVVSRPDHINDKKGKLGKKDTIVRLKANYFEVPTDKRVITLYRVDFQPDTEIRGIKTRLIGQHKATIGGYLFDGGNQLYLMSTLPENTTVLKSTDRDHNQFTVTLRMTRVIRYTEAMFLQVWNLVVRNAMRGLNLQLVGRNFYDATSAVSDFFSDLRLTIANC